MRPGIAPSLLLLLPLLGAVLIKPHFQLKAARTRHFDVSGLHDFPAPRLACDRDGLGAEFAIANAKDFQRPIPSYYAPRRKSFAGVYVRGFSGARDDCLSYEAFEENQGDRLRVALSYAKCGGKRIQHSQSAERTVRSAVVHINFHPVFVTKRDRVFLLRCIYLHPRNLTLSVDLQIRRNSTLPHS